MLKPLDFVKLESDGDYEEHIGIITEVSEFMSADNQIIYSASIEWIGKTYNKTAWFQESSLKVIDNLPNLLSRELRHPFSSHKNYEDQLFPI